LLEELIVKRVPSAVWLERIPDSHVFFGRTGKIRLLARGDQSHDERSFGADFLVCGPEGRRTRDVGDKLTPHIAVRATAAQAANP
jgi:hypothetical protein